MLTTDPHNPSRGRPDPRDRRSAHAPRLDQYLGPASRAHAPVRRTILIITGLRDNASRERVSDHLIRVRGVRDVSVSLMRGQAVVEHAPDCPLQDLIAAVAAAGFVAAIRT
ncbi:MAG: cation transporter [Phycisphaerales bacterium]|nr:cation transporter [Phycisphaerales bacterium]